MKGIIANFIRGGGKQYNSEVIVEILDIDKGDLGKVIGGKVILVDCHGNKYVGRILRRHGAKHPKVIVRFKPNIPGQALGSLVEIIPRR